MRPSPVAHSAAPNGYASTGRVGLKAHPCACNPIRAIPRASRKRLFRPALADRKGWIDQRHSAVALCCLSPLTLIPFRGGEVAQKRPAGWPEWIRASSRSRAASSHDRPVRVPFLLVTSLWAGMCQGSCRLAGHAALAWMRSGRSGLRVTTSAKCQFRVVPLHRCGRC